MEDVSKLGTIIDGIAGTEHVDSSGEVLDVKGMDVSSLGSADSIFNFEHNSKDNPNQVVGKITFAKKIFKKGDCDNERQEYFWDICKKPFVYIKGELFDHPDLDHDGARNVAALLRYDNRDNGKKTRRLISFSVEGGKMEKKGMIVTKSIVRDVALTVKHCNHMCRAEIMDDIKKRKDLYKNETETLIPMIKGGYREAILSDIKKSTNYKEQYEADGNRELDEKSFKDKDNINKEIKKLANKKPKVTESKLGKNPSVFKSENNMRKALVAGMMNATPSSLTGMEALSPENLLGSMEQVTDKKNKKSKKKLKKGQPSLSFNKLANKNKPEQNIQTGVSPEFAATKMANKYSNSVKESVGAKSTKDLSPDTQKYLKQDKLERKNSIDNRDQGTNISGPGYNEGFDFSSGTTSSAGKVSSGQSRKEMMQTKGRGNYPSTKHHEGLHNHLSEISQNFSTGHSDNLIRHILDTHFDKNDIKDVKGYVDSQGYESNHREESLTHVLDFLTSKGDRESFHGHNNKGDAGNQDRMSRLKSGWKNAVNEAKNLSAEDLEDINKKYLEQDKKAKMGSKGVKIQKLPPGGRK